jgi:hypothetical protein
MQGSPQRSTSPLLVGLWPEQREQGISPAVAARRQASEIDEQRQALGLSEQRRDGLAVCVVKLDGTKRPEAEGMSAQGSELSRRGAALEGFPSARFSSTRKHPRPRIPCSRSLGRGC